MRTSCLDCSRKHVAQAEILLNEWRSAPVKYRIHKWYAIGHLSEAEAELMDRWPEHAYIIRQHRILLIAEQSYKVPTHQILEALCDEEAMQSDRMSEDGDLSEDVLSTPLGQDQPDAEGEFSEGVSRR